jgi:hypothetical protein
LGQLAQSVREIACGALDAISRGFQGFNFVR